jgi:hypothetical protein
MSLRAAHFWSSSWPCRVFLAILVATIYPLTLPFAVAAEGPETPGSWSDYPQAVRYNFNQNAPKKMFLFEIKILDFRFDTMC